MTKRRLNPRVNAIHKGLYGKPHPDHVEKDRAPVNERLTACMQALADSFAEAGISMTALADSFVSFANTLREQHREAALRRAVEAYIAADFGSFEAAILHETGQQLEFHGLRSGRYQAANPNLVSRPRGQSPAYGLAAARRFTELYGGMSIPAIPAADRNIDFDGLRSLFNEPRSQRNVYIYEDSINPAWFRGEYTERPIDITLEEPRNRDNPNDRQSTPTYRNPDANIRGFRRR